jgi:hypothetical protein
MGLRVSADGKHLRLRVRDQNGETVSLALPACLPNRLLNALPQPAGIGTIRRLDAGAWIGSITATSAY